MVINEKQIFNLMDTNGRRKDVINALHTYLQSLSEVYTELGTTRWAKFPNELSQFLFYKKAFEASPDVFKKHEKYINFLDIMEKNDLNNYFYNKDMNQIVKNYSGSNDLFKTLDKDIEARARHYTSNLNRIGFADSSRKITSIGEYILSGKKLNRDSIEEIIPIDDINLIYLRQLLKLKVFSKDKKSFYSPMLMAFYLLLKYDNLEIPKFKEIIQGISPYYIPKDIDSFTHLCINENIEVIKFDGDIPQEFKSKKKIEHKVLQKYFKNKKSNKSSVVYICFYNLLYDFLQNKSQENLDLLKDYYLKNQDKIKKAFGYGKNIFTFIGAKCDEVDSFIRLNKTIDILSESDNINATLFKRFNLSKKLDLIREYSDTTMRMLEVTGVIKFKNGLVDLSYKELFKIIFDKFDFEKNIFGKVENQKNKKRSNVESYEGNINGYFYTHHSVTEILKLSDKDSENILSKLCADFKTENSKALSNKLSIQHQKAFENYINESYPLQKVLTILELFSDRKNDKKIAKQVNSVATIPTIYEYITGIAWYYFSKKDFDLLNSLNLSLNADFEPVIHAGGGAGDIVINYEDKIIMLEVTLMNKNAQKRGEWEPVLRHSINLKAGNPSKEVVTFFIADELDDNTINIWRAVAKVPLQSSAHKGKLTNNVMIMPLKNKELISLIENRREVETLLNSVKKSFEPLSSEFDLEWRNKILV